MIRITNGIAAALAVALLAACGGGGEGHDHDHDHDHAAHDHGGGGAGGGHVHVAPRGGILVELAHETAHAEVLFDAATGRLDVYLLGAHAVTPLKSAQKRLRLTVTSTSEPLELELRPVASALTGDTEGSSSHFRVVDARLVGQTGLSGTLGTIEVLGRRYQGATFGSDA